MLFTLVLLVLVNASQEGARGLSAGKPELYTNKTAACSYSDTCSAGGIEGVCVSVSAGCCSGGTITSNLCPGSTDIRCCTSHPCATPAGSGVCQQKSACSGTAYPGYCVGPADLQCCVSGAVDTTDKGTDVSAALSASTAACFASSGYGAFVIPRGFRSTGSIDPNVCTSIKNAASAGIKIRDTYMFPCPKCSSTAASQMKDLVNYLSSNCASTFSGRVWLDIEGSQYWLGSTSSNQAWYTALVNSCATYGMRCGVYSSKSQWQAIFGSAAFSYGTNLPLWYAHYDNNPSFSDYASYAFGGWDSPHAKQYQGDVTLCSFGVDKNFAPNF